MSNDQIPQQDLKAFDEIKTTLSKRQESYGDVLVKFFVGDNGYGWKNAFTTFTILPKGTTHKTKEMNYGNIIYTEKIITLIEFIDSLDELIRESKLRVSEKFSVEFKGRYEVNPSLSYSPSNDRFLNLEWPSNFYQFRTNEGVNVPFGPYVNLSDPLYPDYTALISDKFGINAMHFHQFFGSVVVFLPNYKAKITGMRLDAKRLVMSTTKNIKDDLVAKFFLMNSENVEKPEIKVTESETTIPLNFVPSQIHVYLLNAKTGEHLDHRRIHLNWPAPSEELDLEIANEDIIQLIVSGESDRTEFKQEINKSAERFVQTVIAFANTSGGTVFIGVSDSGEILGSYDQKLEETIQNVIRSNCEPTIKVKVENRTVSEKNIVLISVMEGEDKPYTYRGKGVFVRRGSTNRIASRYELDEFYKTKQNNMPRSSLSLE